MTTNFNNLDNFYHDQNISIRKQIREMDLQYKELITKAKMSKNQIQEEKLRQDVGFLVIGPAKSGKTSLLKTMHFALNSSLNMQITTSQLPGTLIKRFDIKKNKKYNIEGLAKMKETDQKRTICGYEFEDRFSLNSGKQLTSQQKFNKMFQKYSNALQMIDNKVFGCFKVSSFNNSNQFWKDQSNQNSPSSINIKTILITIHILTKTQYEEINCLKFFLADVREKGIKTFIILTHVDLLNHMKENDKLRLIDERINILAKELDIKDRDQFICLENYHNFDQNLQKTDQLGKYISPETRKMISYQGNGNSSNLYQKVYQKPSNQSSGFVYKKVSQFTQGNDSNFKIQIPNLSKNGKRKQLDEYQIHETQQQMSVSRSISCNPNSQPSQYAKISNMNSMQNIPLNQTEKYISKKTQHYPHQPFQNSSQQYFHNNPILTSFKNSEQVNYYSLKLLLKIIQENEKYVSKEMKNRKMMKWFCG